MVEPTEGITIAEGAQRVSFRYDHLGRRVQKRVWTYQNGTWGTPEVRQFVWDGWRLVLEMNGAGTILRKFTWGLDLAGLNGNVASGAPAGRQLEGAGGIGGLLAMQDVQDPNNPNDDLNYAYLYDANGNVGQLIDWAHDPNDPNGAIVARYEYDPYGNVTVQSGGYAAANVWRFSTKQFDAETGLGYWGYRYYSPSLGRWISRDPSEEEGGHHLYVYVGNEPEGSVDELGLFSLSTPGSRIITFTTLSATAFRCGGYRVAFDFKMNGTAQCNGYFIQHVEWVEDVLSCSDCCHRSPSAHKSPSPGDEYWEAAYTPKGSDRWEQGTPDFFSWGEVMHTCGARRQRGEMKFFCRTETGDLNRDPNWNPQNVPEAQGVPATRTRPKWWDDHAIASRAVHWVHASWNCCCKDPYYFGSPTHFDAIYPRVEVESPR